MNNNARLNLIELSNLAQDMPVLLSIATTVLPAVNDLCCVCCVLLLSSQQLGALCLDEET